MAHHTHSLGTKLSETVLTKCIQDRLDDHQLQQIGRGNNGGGHFNNHRLP